MQKQSLTRLRKMNDRMLVQWLEAAVYGGESRWINPSRQLLPLLRHLHRKRVGGSSKNYVFT
jgi:hypothetical protein